VFWRRRVRLDLTRVCKCKKVSRGTDARDLFQFLRHSFSTLRKGFAALGESTFSRITRIFHFKNPPPARRRERKSPLIRC
jgi:hypothetical protein